MVNTLSGSVSAYRKENVKPRFIRIDEVMALLDVTRDEASKQRPVEKENWITDKVKSRAWKSEEVEKVNLWRLQRRTDF